MENARLYSTANTMQRGDAEMVAQRFIKHLPLSSGSRILDIGCGCGDVTAEVLYPRLPSDLEHVIGIDVSDGMVAHAQNAYSHDQLSFLQLDIEDNSDDIIRKLNERLPTQNNNQTLPKKKKQKSIVDIFVNDSKLEFEDDMVTRLKIEDMHITHRLHEIPNHDSIASKNVPEIFDQIDEIDDYSSTDIRFDVAFSFYCLHWVQNQKQALKNIHTLLKPRGETVLIFLGKSPIFTMYEKLAEIGRWSQYMQDVKKYISPYHNADDPVFEFSKLAKLNGFHIVNVECQEKRYVYGEALALKDAIKAVNPFFSRLPKEEIDYYVGDCLNVVQQHKLANEVENGLEVHYQLIIAHLRKSEI